MITCLFQGVDESIKLLQNSGVKVCMITGDGQATATAIATMLGIQSQTGEKIVLSGAEVDTMSDVELQNVADKVINFFSLRMMLFSGFIHDFSLFLLDQMT